MHYSTALHAGWYRRGVCHMIHRSLQGCCAYFAESIDNEVNRTAYFDAFRKCMEICKDNALDPPKMLQELDFFKASLERECKPWVFSVERWISNKAEYRARAVDQAIELVSSIHNKFLA